MSDVTDALNLKYIKNTAADFIFTVLLYEALRFAYHIVENVELDEVENHVDKLFNIC